MTIISETGLCFEELPTDWELKPVNGGFLLTIGKYAPFRMTHNDLKNLATNLYRIWQETTEKDFPREKPIGRIMELPGAVIKAVGRSKING
jgi:hypothetical protein